MIIYIYLISYMLIYHAAFQIDNPYLYFGKGYVGLSCTYHITLMPILYYTDLINVKLNFIFITICTYIHPLSG